ncbi:metalloregulator ArsR/SmtB family transcription factor [Actinomadura sp. KC216]|uniref:ArsR/SmtB family transcription factor n=1 Tax=Actinomadura sp. KC216 TaxID=2530370 RepID=UPI00104C7CE1|nr:metalloregulator ArsR/SmtB family transcription factor [Actinomadura sp. KC216]TDB89016.1 metalloregulator ArsR/SmtB family transcription factor [Actinomadura sp. KC216]
MSSEEKQALLSAFAVVGKALASPLRLELFDILAQGERSVEELADSASARLGNTSAQLQRMRSAGLVTTRRDGNRIYYRLAGDDVAALLRELRVTAINRYPAAARAATDYLGEDVEHVRRDDLLERARTGEVVVLDVRPEPEYAAAHIPGAVSIPLHQLPDRLAELPSDLEIVAYCRGAYCVLAPKAVRLLREQGYPAFCLEDGFLEWRLDELPVETSTA